MRTYSAPDSRLLLKDGTVGLVAEGQLNHTAGSRRSMRPDFSRLRPLYPADTTTSLPMAASVFPVIGTLETLHCICRVVSLLYLLRWDLPRRQSCKAYFLTQDAESSSRPNWVSAISAVQTAGFLFHQHMGKKVKGNLLLLAGIHILQPCLAGLQLTVADYHSVPGAILLAYLSCALRLRFHQVGFGIEAIGAQICRPWACTAPKPLAPSRSGRCRTRATAAVGRTAPITSLSRSDPCRPTAGCF